MNATVRNIHKTVSVPVEITGGDICRALTTTELKSECRRRGVKLKEDYSGRKYKIAQDDLDDVLSLYRRGDIKGALIALERLLPHPMHHLSVDVARHYQSST